MIESVTYESNPEHFAIRRRYRLRRDRLIQLAGDINFKEISKSTLKKVEIPLPAVRHQWRFGSLVCASYGGAEVAKSGSASSVTLYSTLISRLLGVAS